MTKNKETKEINRNVHKSCDFGSDFELREDSKINSNNTQIISGTREIGNLKTQREYMQNLTVSLPQLDGAEAKRDLNSFNIKKRLGLRKDILKMAGSEVFNDKMREKSTERSVSGKAEMFKEFKLGGLGPILKSEEYLQAKNKRLMMNLFSSQVLSTNFKRNKMLSIKNLKLAPKIHSRNKSYVDGVKRRERMENYAATIKRPHYQNTTDFSACQNDRLRTVDLREIQLENQKIRMLFK